MPASPDLAPGTSRVRPVPAPTNISHGPTNPSGPSYAVSASWTSAQVSARSPSESPAIIWCSAPNDSCWKRTQSAADGSSTGDGTRRTSTSANPASASVCSSTPSPPSENGPGWPGSGGRAAARRRMMPTGTEKNALASGVE